MSWGSPGFVIAIIAMSMVGWMVTTWLRAKHGYPVENEWGGTVHRTSPDADRKIALLTDDNARLAHKISLLVDRISVLERIPTYTHGQAAPLADQFDPLLLFPTIHLLLILLSLFPPSLFPLLFPYLLFFTS